MINPVLFDRRQLLAGGTVVAAGALAAPVGARAQAAPTGNEGTVRPGQARAINIAIPDFVPGGGADTEIARQVPQVIANNLRRSGLFAPVDPRSHPERIVNFDAMPNLPQWRAQAAEAVVTGRATRQGDGRIRAEFRLFDTAQGQQIAGQQYFASADNWRRVAHIISDAIYKRMTGEDGYFDTRIVFVDETGPKENRRKRLAIMDQDGANVRYLTSGNDLVLTPRFSPTSQDITYMSFGQQTPRVFLFNIETGQREVVGNFQGMTFSPRFSPDGQRIVMSLSRGGDSNIFVMDLRSRGTQQLTSGASIDTSPSYSPDGRQICFESDRGGGQQIYVMAADGSGVKRISFGQGRYSTPVWSPRGDLIAFTRQAGGRFGVGVIRPDGTGERILTESGAVTEGPTFAPNGRVIMAFRDPGGAGGPHLFTVDITGRNEQRVPTPAFASDPAWSPLLSQT